MENLLNLEYPIEFSLELPKFEYILKNSGIYSEVIDVSVDNNKIIFKESGKLGSSEIVWEEHQLKSLETKFGNDIPLPHEIAGYSLFFLE